MLFYSCFSVNASTADTAIKIRKSAPNVESSNLKTGSSCKISIEGKANRCAAAKTATNVAPVP